MALCTRDLSPSEKELPTYRITDDSGLIHRGTSVLLRTLRNRRKRLDCLKITLTT